MSAYWGEDRKGIMDMYEQHLPHHATVRRINEEVDETLERANHPRKDAKKSKKKKRQERFCGR